LINRLNNITEYNIKNYNKVSELGHILKVFYEIYDNEEMNNLVLYSLGFNAYIELFEGLQTNINAHYLGMVKFSKAPNKNKMKGMYHPSLKNNSPVKNTIYLNKNLILTGPNASGKTTLIKTAMINIITTQQFGCGFYKTLTHTPYKYLHSYLNIPDTSGRDSLFQAEARRCKNIIEEIKYDKHSRHFCIFDELYSGTNPEEAEESAIGFMKYISKNKNVCCLLTTHFVKVCEELSQIDNIINCSMKSNKNGNRINYSYKLEDGISYVKGGNAILTEMDYPDEIINKNKSR
jgi:DNA mismatch repair ATPase MutS